MGRGPRVGRGAFLELLHRFLIIIHLHHRNKTFKISLSRHFIFVLELKRLLRGSFFKIFVEKRLVIVELLAALLLTRFHERAFLVDLISTLIPLVPLPGRHLPASHLRQHIFIEPKVLLLAARCHFRRGLLGFQVIIIIVGATVRGYLEVA